MPITPEMLQRSRAMKASDRWTSYVREQYPPASDARVVVAFASELARWILCYDTEDVVVTSAGPARCRYLKAFYVWAGPNDSYLEPGPAVIRWLRDHDLYSEESVGEWEDAHFAPVAAEKKRREANAWDDVRYEMKQLYNASGGVIKEFVGGVR